MMALTQMGRFLRWRVTGWNLALGAVLVTTTSIASASIENARVEWKKWIVEKNRTIQTSPTSFLNLNDAVYLEKGQLVHLAGGMSAGGMRWQKGSGTHPLLKVEFDGAHAWTQGTSTARTDLLSAKKMELSNGLWVVAEQLTDGALRLRLHNPQHENLKKFRGLEFFPYADEVVIEAELVLAKQFESYDFTTVRNRTAKSWLVGVVKFHMLGQVQELSVYSDTRDGIRSLFIPFKDQTNSSETFGGGRYLDVALSEPLDVSRRSHAIVLNFNYSYHPLCVRSSFFNCVRVPGRALSVAVRAGERLPVESGAEKSNL